MRISGLNAPMRKRMAKLTYRPLALSDLEFIFGIIEPDSPSRAYDFVKDIRDRCRVNLLDNPMMGPARPDLGDDVRIYPMKNRRVVVAYRIVGDDINILRVFYGGADYETLMRDA